MKILVTGSSGTIGTRLCEALLEKEHKVAGADWKPNRWNSDIDKLTVNIDLRDADKLKAESYKLQADMVIHLAANARVYDLVLHPDRAMDNFQTTFNVLEFARVHGIRKCIFASSRETYGNISVGNGTYTEDKAHFMHCESPYTASKIGGEALVEAYKRCYGIDAVIFRFSNVYGAYDDSERVVPLFFHRAKAGEPLDVFGKKKCLDFTYIDDCVDGIILAVEKFDQAKKNLRSLEQMQYEMSLRR